MLENIIEPLLIWYEKNHRKLPWREKRDPYEIWVSEIMLQQTRVEAVKPYFERFLRELPTVKDLAECPQEKLLKLSFTISQVQHYMLIATNILYGKKMLNNKK